jgi:hypothetical protein
MYRPIDVPACLASLLPTPPARVTRPGSRGPWVGVPLPSPRGVRVTAPAIRRWRWMPRPPPWESPRGLLAPGRSRWCGGSVPSGNSTPRQRSSPRCPGSSRRSGPGPPTVSRHGGNREREARTRSARATPRSPPRRRAASRAEPGGSRPRAPPHDEAADAPRSEAVLPAPVALNLADASALPASAVRAEAAAACSSSLAGTVRDRRRRLARRLPESRARALTPGSSSSSGHGSAPRASVTSLYRNFRIYIGGFASVAPISSRRRGETNQTEGAGTNASTWRDAGPRGLCGPAPARLVGGSPGGLVRRCAGGSGVPWGRRVDADRSAARASARRVGRRVRARPRSGGHHPTAPPVVPSRWSRPVAGARVPSAASAGLRRHHRGLGFEREVHQVTNCAGPPASRTRSAGRQGLRPTSRQTRGGTHRGRGCPRGHGPHRYLDTSTCRPSRGRHLDVSPFPSVTWRAGATEPRGWPRSTEDRRRQAKIDEGTPTPQDARGRHQPVGPVLVL